MSSFYGNAGGSGSGGGTADVPVATALRLGKVRPDNETITIDPDGTIHSKGGESSYKEGYLKNGKLYKKANFTGEYQLKSGTLYLDLPTLTQYICIEGALVPLNDKVFIGTTEEWEALSEEEKAKYDVNISNIVDELDNKIDKVEGKDLSTNDFTDEEKSKLAGLTNYDDTTLANKISNIENALSDKVDKDGDKILSTNDFTDAYKNKLDNLSNYDDTNLSERLTEVEDIIPSSASSSNKLATLDDIPEASGGTTNYSELNNKPQIAGVELSGNKTLSELGIQPAEQGKGLSTEDYTTEDKEKLAGLVNYDDSALASKVADIEGLIPSIASEENRLATIEDIPETPEDNTDYNTLTEIITKDADQSNIVEVGGVYSLGGGAKDSEDNDIQVKCLSVDNATNTAIMQTYGVTVEAQPNNIDLSEHYSSYWGELSSTISNVDLPTSGARDNIISPNGAKEVLISTGKLCWLAYPGYAHSPNGTVYVYDASVEFMCAPYFTLDLSKIIINNGTIELSSYKANITDLITKIETKINNRYTKSEVDSALDNKVDKIDGKGLSTEDYTTEDKEKLAGLSNYDDSVLAGRISDLEGVIPGSASAENKLATMADIPTGSSGSGVGTSDYLSLDNKPQIAGVTLSGNRTLADLGIQPVEEGKGLSTEDYTSEEKSKLAGLSNYDDTALDNRVSNVENALSDKVDKDGSKGLSTNDFSNEDKAKLDGLSNYDDSTLVGLIDDLESDLSNKIDKDGDKVLSTNDFTNEDKNKLDNLSNYDDTALSERITDIENIIPNDVSAENKLVTMSDIGETSVITPQDIDRLWEMELEDGDKEGY